jgi:hypothetical protein
MGFSVNAELLELVEYGAGLHFKVARELVDPTGLNHS